MLDEHEVLFYVLKAISVSCDNRRACRDCPFLSVDTNFCILQDTNPANWNMDELKHNILGGDHNEEARQGSGA